jgi:phytoene dehydrogenase-like protein
MSRVRIVGGGLTGILAAFQAHRMGVDDIELHERFDELGGVALPEERHGLEMREGCIYFGPAGDPIRSLLEAYGQAFTDFDNRFGSVSPGCVCTEDFGGPALPGGDIMLTQPTGPSLAERLMAYPPAHSEALARYARWHLGCDLRDVHGSAAIPLAINRVFPLDADIATLAEAKRSDPLADELFAIPRGRWGRTANFRPSCAAPDRRSSPSASPSATPA